jgi:hypothetical protein
VDGDIDAAALSRLAIPDGATRILFRTSNSEMWDAPRFVENFVSVTPDAATVLAERGVLLVGIDYMSIASYRDPAPTHEALLQAGVTILESLDLRAVESGWWALTCLPLRIPGTDGAPPRAVLSRRPVMRAMSRRALHHQPDGASAAARSRHRAWTPVRRAPTGRPIPTRRTSSMDLTGRVALVTEPRAGSDSHWPGRSWHGTAVRCWPSRATSPTGIRSST